MEEEKKEKKKKEKMPVLTALEVATRPQPEEETIEQPSITEGRLEGRHQLAEREQHVHVYSNCSSSSSS